ncbi:hypothetical protein AGDE_12914 [Angomonas deanei]|nr:hypothetical protein AGDE_12914 [Angomonas deanei]|eukprot:EPY23290.1 hypothetical protein AGDE_12914 [Angomonas deanei]
MKLPPYHLTSLMERRLSPEVKQERLSTKAQYLRQNPPRWRYYVGYAFLITMIVFLPMQSALIAYLKLGSKFKIAFAIVSIILTASMCFVFIPDPSRLFRRKRNRVEDYRDNLDSTQDEHEVGMDDMKDLDLDPTEDEAVKTEVDYIAPQYQESFLRNLLTLRLWCLIWTLFCLTGTEYIVILNSSYIMGALASAPVDENMRSLLSVLNGAGSAVGRLLMAAFEHWTQHRPPEKRIPFPWACLGPTTLLIISLVLFLVLPAAALPLPYVLVALANGGQATLTVLIPRTIYGKDAAKHYNFCFVASVLSCIILVRFLYGEWYSVMADKQLASGKTTEKDGGYCFGKECLLMPFCTLLGLVCSSILSTLYLSIKYSRFCKRTLAERRRILEECAAGSHAPGGDEDNLKQTDMFVDEVKSKDQAPEAEEVEAFEENKH